MLNFPLAAHVPASYPVLGAMFEARKRVFVDLLGWDVPVLEDSYEIDQFDTEDAVYIVLTDDRGRHRASTRLLHSEGPHILGTLFPTLCEHGVPTGPKIREITRFCIEPTLSRPERRLARDELVSAVADHALLAGIDSYTAVATRGWFSQVARFGWDCRALGPGRRIGEENLIGLRIDIAADTPAMLAGRGIYRKSAFHILDAAMEPVS